MSDDRGTIPQRRSGESLALAAEGAADRLDSLIAALSLPLSDEIHVECLRKLLPEVARDLRRALQETTS
jgi:hypothetical protein